MPGILKPPTACYGSAWLGLVVWACAMGCPWVGVSDVNSNSIRESETSVQAFGHVVSHTRHMSAVKWNIKNHNLT